MQKQPASSNGKPSENSGVAGARDDVVRPATEKMTVPKPGPRQPAKTKAQTQAQEKPAPRPGPKFASKPGKPVEAVMRVVKSGPGEAPKPAVGREAGCGDCRRAWESPSGAGARPGRAAGGQATSVVRPTPAMMKPHRVQPAAKAGAGSESTAGPAAAAQRPVAGKPQVVVPVAKPGKPAPAKVPAPSAAAPGTVAVPAQPVPTVETLPDSSAPGTHAVAGAKPVQGGNAVPGAKPAPVVRESGDAPRTADGVADRAAASVPEEPVVTGEDKQLAMPEAVVPAADELPDAHVLPESGETAAEGRPGQPAPDALVLPAEDAATGQETVSSAEPASSAESSVEAAPVDAAGQAGAETPAETPVVAEAPEVAEAPAAASAEGRPNGSVHTVALTALMAVSFVLEVALLGAGALWALGALPLAPVVAVLATVIPLMVFWGLFMSPKARYRVSPVPHALLSHALFAAGAVLLVVAGQPALAIAMGALTVVSIVLTLLVRGQDSAGNAGKPGQAAKRRRKSKGSGRRAAR